MNQAVLNSMTDAERRLVAETESASMAALDEDELLELHGRIRRARGKYVKSYRRSASAQVGTRSSRGTAYAENQRHRDKAEVFETSLARVSRQVGKVGRAGSSGAEGRAVGCRPWQHRRTRHGQGGFRHGCRPTVPKRAATKTTGGLKKDASSRAQGARRQAKRDAR